VPASYSERARKIKKNYGQARLFKKKLRNHNK